MPDDRGSLVPKVFISYRREDSQDISGRLYDHLTAKFPPAGIFKDVDSIPLGMDFREHLKNAVGGCEVMIVVIGPRWASSGAGQKPGVYGKGRGPKSGPAERRRIDDPSDFVRIEIEAALERNIPVIPVLVSGADMPLATELPESLNSLAFRQAMYLRPDPDFRNDMQKLIASLERVDAHVREEQRKKAEAEAQAREEAKALEAARQKAEAQAREAQRQKAEAEAREAARQKAEADAREAARVRAEAQARAHAEAQAREAARQKADADAKVRAEAHAREAARLREEADAREAARLQDAAEEYARAEAQAREAARIKAEAQAKAREAAKAMAARDAERRRVHAEALRSKLPPLPNSPRTDGAPVPGAVLAPPPLPLIDPAPGAPAVPVPLRIITLERNWLRYGVVFAVSAAAGLVLWAVEYLVSNRFDFDMMVGFVFIFMVPGLVAAGMSLVGAANRWLAALFAGGPALLAVAGVMLIGYVITKESDWTGLLAAIAMFAFPAGVASALIRILVLWPTPADASRSARR